MSYFYVAKPSSSICGQYFTEEVGVLVARIARKSERWLGRHGYESNEDWDVEASDALPLFQEVSIEVERQPLHDEG